MRAQAAGLARALAGILQAEVLEKTVPLSAVDSPPEVAVACGGSAVWPALNLKRKFGSFAVFTQRPFFGESFFDAVLRPGHDGPGGKNSLAITGSVGPVSAEVLAARRASALARFGHPPPPRIGVLIGGANHAFSFSPEDCGRIRDSLFRARDELGGGGGTILATASRRTGAENLAALRAGNFLQEDGGGNPYLDILAASDLLAVTGDSVNMLSEACSAGVPVLIFPPAARPGWRGRRAGLKFHKFHSELESRGLARLWDGNLRGWAQWKSPGLDETARAAKWLAEKIRAG